MGLYTLLSVAVDVVLCFIFLYRSPFMICTSFGLSGGALLVVFLTEI